MAAVERIALMGPIAEPGAPAVGGYEGANLRLLALFRNMWADARAYAYPRASGGKIRKALIYARGFAALFGRLASQSGRGSAIHFTPLCRHFLFAELLLAGAARIRGNRLVVDLRAGMQESWYRKSTPAYRWAFRRLLSVATSIAFEGESYTPWLESIAPRKLRILLPNFVPATMLHTREQLPLPAAPTLIYVGAVSEAKGVDAALRAFRLLARELPGAVFAVVGSCDPDFRRSLEREGLLTPGVVFTGAVAPPDVAVRLSESHFFLFLTHWFGEGQSNALTEAMARGCVPVVTRHGFSPFAVERPELIVADRDDAKAIAALIVSIWRSGRWQELSDAMVRRVEQNFTDVQVRQMLTSLYA